MLSAPFRREVPEAARRARRERGSGHRGEGRGGQEKPLPRACHGGGGGVRAFLAEIPGGGRREEGREKG